MTWLLTGGAGYIGGHTVVALRDADIPVVVLDDLSTGVREHVPADVPLIEASLSDHDAVVSTLHDHGVTGVIHLAAKKAVEESVAQPLLYYRENVGGCGSLLQAMAEVGVTKMLFSSSAAVYGSPAEVPVGEDALLKPESPYGETKAVCEWMVAAQRRATGLSAVSLRYFNVVGAANPRLGDTSISNLVPLVFRALTSGDVPRIYGDDYPTKDGTCVRDYIHVADLAEAHVAAVRRLAGADSGEVYNVGRGEGFTVREVMDTVRRVTERDFEPRVVGRRAGDPPATVASVEKIGRELGWKARFGLEEMVASAWEAWPAQDR
ncbi:MAG TPA: UDP-glucose 4-epimerase GalE [Actinomycetes bacterium]|jgi:UDP-glucose 4-epimerase|nr:UDP-glucose 4-epimerase GalE [Actinomycetes bacterium]